MLLAPSFAYANSLSSGIWLSIGVNGKMPECPNAIIFKSSTYEVLNDCYGHNPKHPIIETGKYKHSINILEFTDRNTRQKEIGLIPGTSNITATIEKHTRETLILKIDNEIYSYTKK